MTMMPSTHVYLRVSSSGNGVELYRREDDLEPTERGVEAVEVIGGLSGGGGEIASSPPQHPLPLERYRRLRLVDRRDGGL